MDKKVIKSKPLRASLPVLVGLDAEAFKSKYVIDDVLALMQSLVDASQKEVDDYNANWNVSLAEKQSSLAAIITSLNTQGAACSDLSDQLNALNDTIIDLNEQINEYNQSISDNQNKTDSLLASRCEANKNYVKGLKNNKKTLSLVAVLRAAIQQFNETLLQRHVFEDIHQRLIVFLNKHSSLLQTKQNVPDVPDVQERTGKLFFSFLFLLKFGVLCMSFFIFRGREGIKYFEFIFFNFVGSLFKLFYIPLGGGDIINITLYIKFQETHHL